MCSANFSCVNGSTSQVPKFACYANCFIGLIYGFLTKTFREIISLSVVVCSFIDKLGQN